MRVRAGSIFARQGPVATRRKRENLEVVNSARNILEAYDLLLLAVGAALLLTTLAKGTLGRLNVPHTVLFLGLGVLAGPLLLGLSPDDPLAAMPVLERVTELAVIMSLIVLGIRIGRPISWAAWQSTARLILIVMPATIALVALTGHWLLGLALGPAILLGAILAPTDPIIAGALEEQSLEDEAEDRFGLSSEAGLNDGLAFPFIYLGLYATLRIDEWPGWLGTWLAIDVLYAVALALPLGWFLGKLCGRAYLSLMPRGDVSEKRREFVVFGLLLATYGLTEAIGAYGFLSAFTVGLGFRRMLDEQRADLTRFAHFTEAVDGLAKVIVLVMIGALMPWGDLIALGWPLLAFSLILVLVIRPALTYPATAAGHWKRVDRLYWSWFGIRGIGSIYYMSYAIGQGLDEPTSRMLFAITVGAVLVSGVLHGVSLRPFMQAFEGGREVEE
jgi:sodium/hydrogen antiporter